MNKPIIDDLDKLLSSVDNEFDYSISKETEISKSTEQARKYDKNIGTGESGVTKNYAESIKEFKKNTVLKPFHGDYLEGLKTPYENAIIIREYMNDISLPEPVSQALKKYKYSFLKYLENIEKLYDQFSASYSTNDLQKKAKQDFAVFFPLDDIQKNRIDFLALKELFLRLRELNSKMKREWEYFINNFKVMSLVNEVTPFFNKTMDKANTSSEFCLSTDILIQYIAAVLSIPKTDLDVLEKDISNKIFYHDDAKYDFSNVFNFFDIDDDSPIEIPELTIPVKPTVEEKISVKEIKNKNDTTPITRNAKFSLPGCSTWNTREPYLIYIQENILKKNYDDLNITIFFSDEIRKETILPSLIKRALILYKNGKITNIVDNYLEFIFKQITQKADEIKYNFNLNEDNCKIFLYHVGPLTMYKILMNYFTSTGLALCFKSLDKAKVSRFTPNEFIKEKVMSWYNENIHAFDLPFDKIQVFNDIKTLVNEKYKHETLTNEKKIETAINHFYKKTGRMLDKNELFNKKIYELYRITDIPVYQRFVEKNVFK